MRNYDEKVDIFSLGLMFFELTSIFSTEMERIGSLTDARALKLPTAYLERYPDEVSLSILYLKRIHAML